MKLQDYLTESTSFTDKDIPSGLKWKITSEGSGMGKKVLVSEDGEYKIEMYKDTTYAVKGRIRNPGGTKLRVFAVLYRNNPESKNIGFDRFDKQIGSIRGEEKINREDGKLMDKAIAYVKKLTGVTIDKYDINIY